MASLISLLETTVAVAGNVWLQQDADQTMVSAK
jgi:hypothetical protein